MELNVILTGAGNGHLQIAKDWEIIREIESNPSRAILRWYSWEPAAFSIGRGQKPENIFDLRKLDSTGVSWVERPTGGALVYHDMDISYSLTIPRENPWGIETISDLYTFTTGAWIMGLEKLGIHAHPPSRGSIPARRDLRTAEKEICLAYHSPGDILIDGKKFGGSAQRRLAKAWHQQGFFLLRPVTPPDCFKDPLAIGLLMNCGTSLESCGYKIEAGRISELLTESLIEKCRGTR